MMQRRPKYAPEIRFEHEMLIKIEIYVAKKLAPTVERGLHVRSSMTQLLRGGSNLFRPLRGRSDLTQPLRSVSDLIGPL